MKVYRKNNIAPKEEQIKKALDKDVETKKAEDNLEEEFTDEIEEAKEGNIPTVTLTEEEILRWREIIPKIEQLLSGEATIEIIDDEPEVDETEEIEEVDEIEEMEEPEIEEIDEVEESGDEEIEIVEDVEEDKAEDTVPFDAKAILNDPEKRAAIEAELNSTSTKAGDEEVVEPTPEEKAEDAVDEPKKKRFVKRTLNKKAGDSKVKKNPNAELVETPVERENVETVVEKRVFNFHK